MTRSRRRGTHGWYVQADSGDFAFLATVPSAVRRAIDFAAFKRTQVTVYRQTPDNQVVAGVLSQGMFWLNVTDDRLRAEIERQENI